ncbi:hypothetical protein [Streptomyces kronopolitis]|uniref:hypothetical protein n=1 Tax=Streptomyces kronopolitis TaxID=1612435 RepID=UPI003D96B5D3
MGARRRVRDGGTLHKELAHPLVGALLFETALLRIPVRPAAPGEARARAARCPPSRICSPV